MLTRTHVLTMLQLENDRVRDCLSTIDRMRSSLGECEAARVIDPFGVEASVEQVSSSLHDRAGRPSAYDVLDRILERRAGHLQALDALALQRELEQQARSRLQLHARRMRRDGSLAVDGLRDALEACYETLKRRLEIEEAEVVPLAAKVLTGDDWYDLSVALMRPDADAVNQA